MRVLHAPTDVGNQPWGLSRGERALGVDSRSLVYVLHNPGYGADFNLHFERRSRLGRLSAAAAFFGKALWTFDVFHFYFSTTFFPRHVDLPLLKALGKKIFFTFQGCDIRPSAHCPPALLDPQKHTHEPTAIQQRRTKRLLGYATGSYVLNPDLLEWSPTSAFLPYASVDPRQWQPSYRFPKPGEDIILFHAPSDRLVKGTRYVEEAVTALRREGYPVTLDLASGISNVEVRARAARAHLAVDQLHGGWYGAAAVEMMALGKPTLCFIRDDWKPLVPFGKELPIINTTPTTITAVLRGLLDHQERWPSLAHASRAFVERIHDPKTLAQQTVRDYGG